MYIYILFSSLGLHLWHMEVPRLGVQVTLQLLACTTATATWDLSRIRNLHHSSLQHWAGPRIEPMSSWMHTSWVHYHWATTGTPYLIKDVKYHSRHGKPFFLVEAIHLLCSTNFSQEGSRGIGYLSPSPYVIKLETKSCSFDPKPITFNTEQYFSVTTFRHNQGRAFQPVSLFWPKGRICADEYPQ